MRVLILNSDSPKNRGDRAILAGLIEVVRRRWPHAEIHALSQFDQRDTDWFGIRFLPQSPYSVNPLNYIRLLYHARRADVVLWGGGEILKDYTNRLGLIYWALKVTGLSWVNRNLFGAFQGIGPTTAASSRRAIAYTVNRTAGFVVRDEESMSKLRDWGVSVPVIASFDPAVLAPVAEMTPGLRRRVSDSLGVDEDWIRNVAGIGARRWFHYRKGGWLPFAIRGAQLESAEFQSYRANIARLADRIVEEDDANVLFVPMHMAAAEGDDSFAHDVISLMRHSARARVLDADDFSPSELSAIIGECKFFVASRLHSAILAAAARVPAVVLYYVDKGRLFYEQMGLVHLSRPIEVLLASDGVEEVGALVVQAREDRAAVVATLDARISEMAGRLFADAEAGWKMISKA